MRARAIAAAAPPTRHGLDPMLVVLWAVFIVGFALVSAVIWMIIGGAAG